MSGKIVDQRAEALEYLNKHNILKLFDLLGAKIAKDKPKDPNSFLVSELEKITDAKALNETCCLFTERDVEIMFSIFDLTNKGYVQKQQYLKALQAVGVNAPHLFPFSTAADDRMSIDKATFIKQIYAEVMHSSYGSA